MEFASGGDLSNLIADRSGALFEEAAIWTFMTQIAQVAELCVVFWALTSGCFWTAGAA